MTDTTLTIRRAAARDGSAVARLAALDGSSPPTGELLLAEVGDELWAAVEIGSGAAVADPFRPSGEVVELLRFRAAGIGGGPRAARGRRLQLHPRAA
ncbi:MAG TPA: hypothetical protein VEY90_08525 [Thermoleophilaceae bacterium]|jgi:hypothetical protein|nr:hypothetical protein [Thermoleophilaceae bacterium]